MRILAIVALLAFTSARAPVVAVRLLEGERTGIRRCDLAVRKIFFVTLGGVAVCDTTCLSSLRSTCIVVVCADAASICNKLSWVFEWRWNNVLQVVYGGHRNRSILTYGRRDSLICHCGLYSAVIGVQ